MKKLDGFIVDDDFDELKAKFNFNPPKPPEFNYHKPENIHKDLASILDPKKFLTRMIEIGELDKISDNYSKDCFMLCNCSVAWAISQLMKHPKIFKNIQIVEGSFKRNVGGAFLSSGEHWWLLYKDSTKSFYIDLTLAQFIKKAPQLAIVDAIDSDLSYTTYETYSPNEYVKKLQREQGMG